MFSVKKLRVGDEIRLYADSYDFAQMEILRGSAGQQEVVERPPVDGIIHPGKNEVSSYGKQFLDAIEQLLAELDHPLALNFLGAWMDDETVVSPREFDGGEGDGGELRYCVVSRKKAGERR